MTIEAVDSLTLKSIYDEAIINDPNPVSYKVWLKKLHRLEDSNIRTKNATKRKLGVPEQARVDKRRLGTQFVSFDGEGYENKYVLLANSLGERIVNPDGLSSFECLSFLATGYEISTKRVGFSIGYDVNMILRDLPDDLLETLFKGKMIEWESFKVHWIPGKIFSVNGYKYYDVFSFFATSFINVITLMLGEDRLTKEMIEGKAARGNFETWDMEKIIAYNDEELQLLVEIMDKLRQAFHDVDIYLTEWYGPGAAAKYCLQKYKVKPDKIHDFNLLSALNGAYYGGRFEQMSLGSFKNVYEYDIHSAYPAVMADMPYMTDWRETTKFEPMHPYSIWYIEFDLRSEVQDNNDLTFFPLPMRSTDGRICFPLVGKGWYWYSEVQLVLKYFPRAKLTFHRGYIATGRSKPFEWVRVLYNYRQQLKDAGNLSQYAIKVVLNSLYGKTAQRVGSNDYFSLSWAGFITSSTRAKLAAAGYDNGTTHIIGFATDALFSTKKLQVPISDDLGDWEESRFDKGLFLQSGVYRLQNDGIDPKTNEPYKPVDRYRGSPLRNGIDDVIQQLKASPSSYPTVKIGRFISHLLAIKAPKAYGPFRLHFVKVTHKLQIDAPYKRHYTGFLKGITRSGVLQLDYGRLLTRGIGSLPKIWVNDEDPFRWSEYLAGHIKFDNVESSPPPMKDTALQATLEEATPDNFNMELSELDSLPSVEEIME